MHVGYYSVCAGKILLNVTPLGLSVPLSFRAEGWLATVKDSRIYLRLCHESYRALFPICFSLCDARREDSCSQIFSRFPDDDKVDWISVMYVNASTFSVRGFVKTHNPERLVTFLETVERGKT